MKQLDGKIALVTGGSRGLGLGIVQALAAEGADVWALARNAERLDQLGGDGEFAAGVVLHRSANGLPGQHGV
jgi:NAD(P)-dependent dehydrogenase (short-subunit alcohol dehydrogenase family)